MKTRDIIVLLLCCIIWGANIPITRWAINDAPPILVAAMRFLILSVALSPFLRPVPKQLFRVFIISICIGGLNFLFLYIGIQSTPASVVAIIGQLGLPITIFFSVWFLGETISFKQAIGILMALIGVFIVIYKPNTLKIENGILMVFVSAILASIGNVIMKKMQPIRGVQLQAWVGLFSFAPLLLFSAYFEKTSLSTIINFAPHVWLALLFSVFCVSIVGHITYYSMVKKYDVSLVIPYTVTVPIWAILISHLIFDEKITLQFIFGTCICLIGIGVLSFKNIIQIKKGNFYDAI